MKLHAGAFVLASTAFIGACSSKDAHTDTTAAAQAGTAAAPTTSASRGAFDPATHVATVYAKDFAFEAPDSITAGWTTIHLVNEGPNIHHGELVRLDSGKTVADLEAALKNPGPPPAWMTMVGGPNAPAPGGGTADATVKLTPGQYALLCFVDMPDHVPHFAKGMVHPIKVVASTGPEAPEPTADATITLADYSFATQGALNAGKHTIKVVNKGPQPHELELVRLNEGKTAKDVAAWVAKPDGPPPGTPLGGVAPTMTGHTDYMLVDLTPGRYALLCFLPDAKDGKPHVEHGMAKEFEVK